MKQAIVSPRIKKDNLPRNELKSYRPISNLSFVAKLVERTVAGQVVESSSHARNLGCIMDRHLMMKEHVAAVCRSAMIVNRRIGQIRQYLTTQATQALVHAFITSRLDNNNSLLFGPPQNLISQLQRIQNNAATIVNKVPRKQDISKSLKQLHRLPVEKRILFKILFITFKSIQGKSPSYIASMINTY
nr:uncharacterized protein LOC129278217 [Lytechinus pictus]